MRQEPTEREVAALLRRLSTGAHKSDRLTGRAAEAAAQRGLIAGEAGGAWRLTATGIAMLRRALSDVHGFAQQHQDRGTATVKTDVGVTAVTVNHDESPLAWLRRRRDKSGRPMIGAAEFSAGERFRSDYERGRILPRVTANWTASVAGGRRDGGIAELTEAALGARRRVEHALSAVGPEFGGLLVDFCCFLKGLEEIERERRWPARSAKVVLRLGLASLARHYGLSGRAERARSAKLRHWGTEDYRPVIDGA